MGIFSLPVVKIGAVSMDGTEPVLMLGPCVIESEEFIWDVAEKLGTMAQQHGWRWIFKASYDKANRSAISSYRGLGCEAGCKLLARIGAKLGVPVTTDVHSVEEVKQAAEHIDLLQIPAFLCRQTDLIVAAVKTGAVVNIKKGQFVAPWDMAHSVQKAREAGGERIWLTERGACFGYNNLVTDMRSLMIMGHWGYPVIFDATHSVQIPSGAGGKSGGQREFIEPLIRGAVAVGVDGVFLEVHDNPDQALCDGPNSLPLERLPAVLEMIKRIDHARRGE